jgi:hypothetical protein
MAISGVIKDSCEVFRFFTVSMMEVWLRRGKALLEAAVVDSFATDLARDLEVVDKLLGSV